MIHLEEPEHILADMLTENTGTHMLDSGGAYGRNWERNQGKTVDDFMAAPAVTEHHDDRYPMFYLSLFHYLRDRLLYDPDEQDRFDKYVAITDDGRVPWLVNMKQYAEAMNDHYPDTCLPDGPVIINSVNEDNLLDQVIQFTVYPHPDGEPRVLLQIHGGCDVRGGYTRPRAFSLRDSYDEWYQLVRGWDGVSLQCPESDGMHHYVDIDGPDISDNQGIITNPWDEDSMDIPTHNFDGVYRVPCPYCDHSVPMTPYMKEW